MAGAPTRVGLLRVAAAAARAAGPAARAPPASRPLPSVAGLSRTPRPGLLCRSDGAAALTAAAGARAGWPAWRTAAAPAGGRRGLASTPPLGAAAAAAPPVGGGGALHRAVAEGPAAALDGLPAAAEARPPLAAATDAAPTAAGDDAAAAAPSTAPLDVTTTASDGAAGAVDAVADAAAASSGLTDYLLLPIRATLEAAHTMTGLPWWATIALTTLAVRGALLPISLRVNRRAHRARLLQPRIKELQAAVMQAAEAGDREAQKVRQAAMMAFMNKHGVSPAGTLKDMAVQMPVFLGFFATINRLVAEGVPGLATEGALWFVDLTVRDAYYGLPLLTGATTAVMVGAGGDGANAMAPAARKGMMALGFLIVPLSAYFPTALFCYWLPSNLVSLAMALA
ncbi:hypothetical protein BU14_2814s0001, partial [Porphyra umbilicalis]